MRWGFRCLALACSGFSRSSLKERQLERNISALKPRWLSYSLLVKGLWIKHAYKTESVRALKYRPAAAQWLAQHVQRRKGRYDIYYRGTHTDISRQISRLKLHFFHEDYCVSRVRATRTSRGVVETASNPSSYGRKTNLSLQNKGISAKRAVNYYRAIQTQGSFSGSPAQQSTRHAQNGKNGSSPKYLGDHYSVYDHVR